MQARILFLRSPQLPPLRDAVNAAVECRHAEVRKPWAVTLGCFGFRSNQSDNGVQKVMGAQATILFVRLPIRNNMGQPHCPIIDLIDVTRLQLTLR